MAANNMDTILQAVQDIIGYRFKERLILWEAMQAAGSNVRYAGDREIMDGNKRLAVIGDTVLQLVLAEQWYNGGTSREQFNQTLSQVASNANLDRIGRQRGLQRFVNGNPSQRQVVSPITMAATMEAIIGAVYLDNDLEQVWEVMQTLGLVPPSHNARESIDDQAYGA
ncbi:MAG: hypothetical protein Q9161_004544 [Pseudevernia consocians]